MAFTLGTITAVGLSTATSRSQSHTVASGVRLLTVSIAVRGAATLTNVKYGTQNMTLADQHGDAGDFERLAVYYLVDPTVGTANVTYTVSAGESNGASVASWACTNTPSLDVVAHNSNLSGGSIAASVSGATGTLLLSSVNGEDNASPGLTKEAEETAIHPTTLFNGSFGLGTSYELNPASNETSTWTKNGGGEVAVIVLAVFKEDAGGGGVTLAAVVDGTLVIAPALRVEKPLAAVVAGTAGITPALTDGKPLAAVVDGTATITPALTDGKPLAALVDGTSGLTPALAVGKPLAALVDGVSGIAAALAVSKPIQAVVDGTLGISASLNGASSALLAAVVDGASGIVADLRVQKPVAAVVDGVSGLVASLSSGKPLAALVDSTSTMTAALTAAKTLAATVVGTSAQAAAMATGKPLAAAVSSTSDLVARLTVGAATGVVKRLRMMVGAGR